MSEITAKNIITALTSLSAIRPSRMTSLNSLHPHYRLPSREGKSYLRIPSLNWPWKSYGKVENWCSCYCWCSFFLSRHRIKIFSGYASEVVVGVGGQETQVAALFKLY